MMQSASTAPSLVSVVATPLTVPSDTTGLATFIPTATDTKVAYYTVPGAIGTRQEIKITLGAGDAGFKNQFFVRFTRVTPLETILGPWHLQFTQNVDPTGTINTFAALGGDKLSWKVVQNGGGTPAGTLTFLPVAGGSDQFRTQVPAAR